MAVTAAKITTEFIVATTMKLLLSTVLSDAAIFELSVGHLIKKQDVLIGAQILTPALLLWL